MSLRKAINAKCQECIYDPISGNGGVLQQIYGCTCYSCPLYAVRPMPREKSANLTIKTASSADVQAVRS
jgi:hypothetical protein